MITEGGFWGSEWWCSSIHICGSLLYRIGKTRACLKAEGGSQWELWIVSRGNKVRKSKRA